MIRSLVLLAVVFAMTRPLAAAPLGSDTVQRLDEAVADAIEEKLTPGAVIVAGRRGGNVFEKAYGHFMYESGSPAVKVGTVYDLASLSKPIGCATSIMILADRGKLSVTDPVSKYIPGMDRPDKKDITIEQCLLHTAGFVGDNPMKDFTGTHEESLAKVYAAKLKYPPGTDYLYSDNSFIVLGEVVKAVSGKPLDEFARENVFKPLKMNTTSYNPPKKLWPRVAPTEKRDGKWIAGQVHDPRAYALGGVAGHAGVFGTAGDVARWCRMLLNKGELDGARILSPKAVAAMTRPHPLKTADGGKSVRAYGIDVDTRHSASPRGTVFEPRKTYGHTGYTGTSLWIDPANDCFVVLLTNRVHPDDKASISPLRKSVASIVAEAMIGQASE